METQTNLAIGNSKSRRKPLQKALFVQIGSIIWNIVEGLIALYSGVLAGSVALVGFGIDSLIETASAAVVGWRLSEELRGAANEQVALAERTASRVAGLLLFALAAYIGFDGCRRLAGYGEHPDKSAVGLGLTAITLVVMFGFSRAKLKLAAQIESKSLRADAMETVCCAWMSFTTLAGLLLNMLFGWWWADAAAGLLLVPMLIREGLEAIKGTECGCHEGCQK